MFLSSDPTGTTDESSVGASDAFQAVSERCPVGANQLARKHSINLHPDLWFAATACNTQEWFRMTGWRWWALMGPSLLIFLINGWWRILLAPVVKAMGGDALSLLVGSRFNRLFTCISQSAFELRDMVTSSGSLAIVYNYVVWANHESAWRQLTLGERLMRFHMMQPDAVSVRMRAIETFKVSRKRLEELLKDSVLGSTFTSDSPLIFPVLACGNAQSEIDALFMLYKDHPEFKGRVRLHLVDFSKSALDAAKSYAEHRDLSDDVQLFHQKIKPYLLRLRKQGTKIYMLDIVGFLDYYPRQKIMKLMNQIYDVVQKGATIIAALISHSRLWFSVRFQTNWPLLVRQTREEFLAALTGAGIELPEIEIISCLGVHNVAVITKL